MFYFFTSDYEDARPVIQQYKMKKFTGPGRLQLFKSQDAALAVCGNGAVNASVAVTYLMQTFSAQVDDLVIGIGSWALKKPLSAEDIMICVKLKDMSTGRDHYPDMLFTHPFTEAVLVSHEISQKTLALDWSEEYAVEDALGAFVYQAALFFVPSYNIHIIKLIPGCRSFDEQICEIDHWLRRRNKYQSVFSHIYIEEAALKYPAALEILAMHHKAKVIKVGHYKDVFCKKGQDFSEQKNSQKLILAVNRDTLLRKGSENCDDYGHENFYYSTHIMNCLFNCEYCYLQGMYMSANIVVFVNLDDVFAEVDKYLQNQKMYICLSYDGDLLMFERFGFIRKWVMFARKRPSLEIEIRSKSAAFELISDIPAASNIILAWTFSPQNYIDRFEHGTPALDMRKNSAIRAIRNGWRVRICVDPMLFLKNCENIYKQFFMELKDFYEVYKPESLSVGIFRAPERYIRKIKKYWPDSEIIDYKFINGTYSVEDKDTLLKNVDFC